MAANFYKLFFWPYSCPTFFFFFPLQNKIKAMIQITGSSFLSNLGEVSTVSFTLHNLNQVNLKNKSKIM